MFKDMKLNVIAALLVVVAVLTFCVCCRNEPPRLTLKKLDAGAQVNREEERTDWLEVKREAERLLKHSPSMQLTEVERQTDLLEQRKAELQRKWAKRR